MINGEKFKHLSDENRMEIQNGLNTGCTFKQIGRRIGKDPTTVSKEVKKHIEVRPAKDAQNTVLCEKSMYWIRGSPIKSFISWHISPMTPGPSSPGFLNPLKT
jgi:IS30 family transposase